MPAHRKIVAKSRVLAALRSTSGQRKAAWKLGIAVDTLRRLVYEYEIDLAKVKGKEISR